MDIEYETRPRCFRKQSSDDQEVWRIVHLQDVVSPSKMQTCNGYGCEGREADVLSYHGRNGHSMRVVKRQPDDVHAVDRLRCGLALTSHCDDIYLPAGRTRCLGFPLDPRFRIRAVDEHAESSGQFLYAYLLTTSIVFCTAAAAKKQSSNPCQHRAVLPDSQAVALATHQRTPFAATFATRPVNYHL